MITIFRNKSIVTIFSLIALCLLTHLHIFFIPVQVHDGYFSGFISWIFHKYSSSIAPFFLNSFYIIVILIQAIRINVILNNHKLFNKSAFTTSLAYILFTGLFTNAYSLSVALIANSLVIWIFSFSIKLYNNSSAKGLLFNLGLLASVSILFFQPLAIITIGLLFALIVLRPFKISEWFIFLLGVITPFYIILSFLYLTDQLSILQELLPITQFKLYIPNNTWDSANYILIAILSIAGLVTWYPNSNRMVIQSRKSWGVILIFLILSIIGALIFTSNNYYTELICLIPLSAFVSNFFLYPSKKILVHILLLAAFVVITYNNLTLIKG